MEIVAKTQSKQSLAAPRRKAALEQLRQQSADFVRALVEKASQKEEPATPNFGEQDVQKIELLTSKLKEKYSGKRN